MEPDSTQFDNKNENDKSKLLQPNVGESQDFLSFNSPTSTQNNYPSTMKNFINSTKHSPIMQRETFNPQGFSSPIVQHNRFNNTTTPRHQQHHHWKHPYNRQQGGGGGRTPYNQKGDWKTNRDDKKFTNSPKKNESIDINDYFHPSMLEDPWANFDTTSTSKSSESSDSEFDENDSSLLSEAKTTAE